MIFNLFFLFSNAETTIYQIKDLFDVRQGKLVLHNDSNNNKIGVDKLVEKEEPNSVKVLTLNSINWELSTIKAESLFNISKPKTMPKPLSSMDYIINRVGQTKGCSLLESNFDFGKHKVIPSHHFLVCTPRKIIIDKLPFFHAVLEIYLNDLIVKKIEQDRLESKLEKKQKSIYVTVKEIENIEVEIPSENFDLLTSQFEQYYSMYATSYRNFMVSKENLYSHKLELAKLLKKEID